jgi:hypothetical protein
MAELKVMGKEQRAQRLQSSNADPRPAIIG